VVKQQQATLTRVYPLPPFWAADFALAHPPTPGKFVLAELGGALREPLYPAGLAEAQFTTLVRPHHPVTQLLPGATVDVLGPLGHGFEIEGAQRLLLVAEALWLPPLLPLLEAAPNVALVIEATTRALLPSPTRIPPAVELHLITQDGSAGHLGTLEQGHDNDTPLRELLPWAERACFACDPVRYPALARLVRETRLHPGADFAQALVQMPLPCGVGACEVCRVMTRHGERRACVDGPVFDLLALDVT